MLKIGITGGIGSGKTTVAHIFELLGVPIYYTDFWAKEILNSDPIVIRRLKKVLGADIYDDAGKADRKKIATIVFNDKNKLNELNSIIHPAVWIHGENWIKQQDGKPYILKEAAILFESGSNLALDKVIMISAPKAIKIERVMKRDSITQEEVESRMASQWDDEKKIKLSDFVIINDGKELVIPQVLKIHQKILSY